MTRQRVNWSILKRDYVQSETPVSLEALADKYHTSKSMVFQHSSDESWVNAREDHWGKIAENVREQAITKTVKKQMTQLEKAESAFDGLVLAITAINKRIEKADFSDKVGKVEITKLMERLASLNTALDKMGRFTQLLKGNADSRIGVDLASLLSTDQDSDSE